MFKNLLLIIFILISFKLSISQVVLNEFMSLNLTTISDEDGDFSDWLEIFNSGTNSLNLYGYTISDDIEELDKWTFPDISLLPGEFLLVFASGKDRLDYEIYNLHTNFKIKSSGEALYFSEPGGNIVDSIYGVELRGDISFGRKLDDPEVWNYFFITTPDLQNANISYTNIINKSPTFNIEGGYFNESISLILNPVTNEQILYTLDGSDPVSTSTIYSTPIIIENSQVLKAFLHKEDYLPGPIIIQTYINEEDVIDKSLPLISISADPDELFNETYGLFNYLPGELEKQVYIQLYEPEGSLLLNSNAGMKIFGNEPSTGYDFQQSLALFARREYGDGSFNGKIFLEKRIDNFEAFILRNNKSEYDIYDGVGQGLVQDILATQAYQPVVVFINGEYWGILNMMEKINEHYVSDNFSIDPDSVDVLNGFETDEPYYHPDWAISGNVDEYIEMIDFFIQNDLSDNANYQIAKSMIDVDYFATYQNAEIFMANVDWPGNNTKFWREKGNNGKWRWIVFDIDAGLGAWAYDDFDYTYNTLLIATEPDGPSVTPYGQEATWPNPPWSTYVLRKLLENSEFQNLFIVTMCDLLALNFDPVVSKPWVGVRMNNVKDEIVNHFERWDFDWLNDWYQDSTEIKYFLDNRPGVIIEHYKDFFDLGEMVSLNVDVQEGGLIQINNQTIRQYPWSGKYFENLEVSLSAIPDIGFQFTNWDGIQESASSFNLAINNELYIEANFEPIPGFERIVINEICYNSAETDDWIELYNPTDLTIELSEWKITDDGTNPFIMPIGTSLDPDEYLVICKNESSFISEYGSIPSIGNLEYGLSKRGDILMLYNDEDLLIDMFEYKVVYPWPESVSALSLIDCNLDNTFPGNWQNTEARMTPGMPNDIEAESIEETGSPSTTTLFDAFPNPLSNYSTIPYKIDHKEYVQINLFDTNGRLIKKLVSKEQESGHYSVMLNGELLNNGVYYYSLQTLESSITKKIIVIK